MAKEYFKIQVGSHMMVFFMLCGKVLRNAVNPLQYLQKDMEKLSYALLCYNHVPGGLLVGRHFLSIFELSPQLHLQHLKHERIQTCFPINVMPLVCNWDSWTSSTLYVLYTKQIDTNIYKQPCANIYIYTIYVNKCRLINMNGCFCMLWLHLPRV